MNTVDVIERSLSMLMPVATAQQIDVQELGWAIEQKIPTALEVLARNIAMDDQRRELLRPATPFNATLTSGAVDLASVITANRILLDHMDSAEILMTDRSNLYQFQWVKSQAELAMTRITDPIYIHCQLTGTLLSTRNVDGSLTSLSGPIDIFANFIPASPAQVPVRLEGEFVGLVAAEAKKELGIGVGSKNWPRGQRTPLPMES